MDVELLGKLHDGPIAFDGGKRHLRLEAGVWFRRGRLDMVSPDSQAQRARRQAEIPLSVLCRFPGAALSSHSARAALGDALS